MLGLRSAQAWSSVGEAIPYDLQDTLHQALQAARARLTWPTGGEQVLYVGFHPVDDRPLVVTGNPDSATASVWDPVAWPAGVRRSGRLWRRQ